MPEDQLPNFTGKVVLVQLAYNLGQWAFPEPVFEMQGGQLCLVGKPLPEEALWTRRVSFCIPWKFVGYYLVFDSTDAYQSFWEWQDKGGDPPPKPRRSWFRGSRD